MKSRQKGFTLIELLIVIALLGTLAVALLAALDPFEQLKKGTDTGTRNTTIEYHEAVIRFFALKGVMPWCKPGVTAAAGTCTNPLGVNNTSSLTAVHGGNATTSPYDEVQQIIDSGELKSNFVQVAGTQMDNIVITGDWQDPTVIVCYKPTSKAFQSDANTKYCGNGAVPGGTNSIGNAASNCGGATAPANCKSAGGNVDCYWCVE